MEKEKQEALQWFVDFANTNLQEIKPGDKAKLLVEAEDYLLPKEEIQAFSSIKDELVEKMPWAFNQSPKKSSKYWKNLIALQNTVRGIFVGMSEHPYPVKGIKTLPWSTAFIRGEAITKMERGQGKEPIRLFYLQVTKTQSQYVWLKIERLLEGLPGHTIQECPGCRRFFFNPTLREKNFCSSRCMWKVNATKRREADREGYRKYHKEYMMDLRRQDAGLPPLKKRMERGLK